MRRTSTLASTLAALADATAALPGLTCGELRRVRVFAEGLRRERLGVGPATSDAVASAAPCLEVLATVVDHRHDLDAALGLIDRMASLHPGQSMVLDDEAREPLRRLVERLATVLGLLVGIDGTELQALTLLLRAQRDGEPPT